MVIDGKLRAYFQEVLEVARSNLRDDNTKQDVEPILESLIDSNNWEVPDVRIALDRLLEYLQQKEFLAECAEPSKVCECVPRAECPKVTYMRKGCTCHMGPSRCHKAPYNSIIYALNTVKYP